MKWYEQEGVEWIKITRGRASWVRLLLLHYVLGEGKGLYFKGGEWGNILLEDEYISSAIRSYLIRNARYYMSREEDTGTWNCPVPGMFGSSSVTFDVDESIAKHLLGGGSLYMSATWTKVKDSNTGEITLTLEATFIYSDYMDLHPLRHPFPDLIGKWAEFYWNLNFLWCTGKKAQPYPLLIESDPVTIVLLWKPESPGIITILSDFP